MTKYLYLEGATGISGDMIVAALLDMGGDRERLDSVLKSLPLDGYDYAVSQKNTYSIAGCDFDVRLHHHEHHHEEGYEHHHEHRHLADVLAIIDAGTMSDGARNLAKKIFGIVADAEAKAHGCSREEVHFHEVGAVDSVVDIVSAAVLIDDLQIDGCIVSGLTEGRGFVRCQHGSLPVPVPAVMNIAERYGIVLRPTDIEGEMVTPTGIAIAAALCTENKLPERYKIVKSGIGLGKRDFGRANFLRVMLVEDVADEGQIYVVESNIDDSTPEELGLAMEKLLAAGVRDVHFEPCFMKKNRPAYILRVITTASRLVETEELIFRYTSTIGLRKYPVERTCMEREIVMVSLDYGQVEVKKSTYQDIVRCQPEYESVKKISESSGVPFYKVFADARQKAEEVYGA